jgi:hypothetical protein
MDLATLDSSKLELAMKLATTLAKSNVVPQHFRGKAEDVFACLVMGSELGFQPMTALNSFVNIQGTTAPKAQAMLSLAKSRLADLIVVIDEGPNEVTTRMTLGKNTYSSTWNDKRAADMGLLGKDNYRKQKATMFKWRSVSDCLKIICPHILNGLSLAEELQDLDGEVIKKPAAEMTWQECYEEDFPTPPEEKECGPLYRIRNGKFRGKQLKELTPNEITDYATDLNTRKHMKPWEQQLYSVLTQYLVELKLNEVVVNEVKL